MIWPRDLRPPRMHEEPPAVCASSGEDLAVRQLDCDVAAARRLPPPETGVEHGRLARLLALTGDAVAARRELALADEYARHHCVRENSIASAYVALGNKENAFEWLNRLFASDGSSAATLNTDLDFLELRKNPRFLALFKRAGLTP